MKRYLSLLMCLLLLVTAFAGCEAAGGTAAPAEEAPKAAEPRSTRIRIS